MPISVEVLAARPDSDRADWDRVIENHLSVDQNGILQIESPVPSYDTCDVDPGDYVAEVSGRGLFKDPNQLGASEVADVWRIRLWPDDGGALGEPKACRYR